MNINIENKKNPLEPNILSSHNMSKKKKEINMNQITAEESALFGDVINKHKPLEVVGKAKITTGWEVIKSRKYNKREDKPIEEWTNQDLFLYLKDELRNKFNFDYNKLSPKSGSAQMGRVEEKLKLSVGGKISKTILKEYIDWFLENECKKLIERYVVFKIQYLLYPTTLSNFARIVPTITKSKNSNEVKKNQSSPSNILNLKSLEASYQLSFDNFVRRYGVVISVMFLINKKGYSEKEAVRLVFDSIIKGCNKDNEYFDILKKNTIKFAPYNTICWFGLLEKMIKKIKDIAKCEFDIESITFSDKISVPLFIKE